MVTEMMRSPKLAETADGKLVVTHWGHVASILFRVGDRVILSSQEKGGLLVMTVVVAMLPRACSVAASHAGRISGATSGVVRLMRNKARLFKAGHPIVYGGAVDKVEGVHLLAVSWTWSMVQAG